MNDGPSTPPSDTGPAEQEPAPAGTWTGTGAPPPTAGRVYVPAGGSVPEGWYQSVNKPSVRSRVRAAVTRRVPLFAAVLALLVGLGVGGGTAFALADGHGDTHSVVDGRGAHDGSDGHDRSGR